MFVLITEDDKVICGYHKREDAMKYSEIWNKSNSQVSVLEIKTDEPIQTYKLIIEGEEDKIITNVLGKYHIKSGHMPDGREWRIEIKEGL
jgi:hypothetical protein